MLACVGCWANVQVLPKLADATQFGTGGIGALQTILKIAKKLTQVALCHPLCLVSHPHSYDAPLL